jgi:hypothetical protein
LLRFGIEMPGAGSTLDRLTWGPVFNGVAGLAEMAAGTSNNGSRVRGR